MPCEVPGRVQKRLGGTESTLECGSRTHRKVIKHTCVLCVAICDLSGARAHCSRRSRLPGPPRRPGERVHGACH